MPKYFFHLVAGDHLVRDETGVELKELSAAHFYGLRLQEKIRCYSPEPPFEWMVKVASEDGVVPLVILPQSPNRGTVTFRKSRTSPPYNIR